MLPQQREWSHDTSHTPTIYSLPHRKQDMLDILKDYGKPNVNAKQVAKVLGKAVYGLQQYNAYKLLSNIHTCKTVWAYTAMVYT